MKSLTHLKSLPVLLVLAFTVKSGGQDQLEFTQGLQDTFNADWEGVAARTYFMQFSINLEDWHFAPFIDFGDGEHSRGIESDAEKFFVRLHYGDFPGINSLDDAMSADFDGDGLNNLFEVMNGFNPYETDSDNNGIPDGAEDVDEDGKPSIFEQTSGTNPIKEDNPAVKLIVVVGN